MFEQTEAAVVMTLLALGGIALMADESDPRSPKKLHSATSRPTLQRHCSRVSTARLVAAECCHHARLPGPWVESTRGH